MAQNLPQQHHEARSPRAQTVRRVLSTATGMILAGFSAALSSTLAVIAYGFVVDYFDIDIGLLGPFLTLGIASIAFLVNLLLLVSLLRYLGNRVMVVWRTYLAAFFVLVGINLLFSFGLFGLTYIAYHDQLPTIRERQHVAKVITTAKSVTECASITQDYQWASCVKTRSKVRTETDLQSCLEEAKTRIIPHAPESSLDDCRYAYAVTNRRLSFCNSIHAAIDQGTCVYDLVWGTSSVPALNPAAAAEQCALLEHQPIREGCFILILRKLERSDPLVNRVCQNIPPGKDFGAQANQRIREFCSRSS